jgi:isoamylase
MPWSPETDDRELLSFVSELIKFRKSHSSFRRRNFFQGPRVPGASGKDIVWLTPDGREMTGEEWQQSDARCLGFYLHGSATNEDDDRGRPIIDDDFVLLLNNHHEPIPFALPRLQPGDAWRVILDTSRSSAVNVGLLQDAERFPLQAGSLALLTRVKIGATAAKTVDGLITASSALTPGASAPSASPGGRQVS